MRDDGFRRSVKHEWISARKFNQHRSGVFSSLSQILPFDQVSYQGSPACLMPCSKTAAIVAMEILVEKNEILPMRIVDEASI